MPSIYKITYQDGTFFNGGSDILNSKWKDVSDKGILCLEYFLSENESILLKDFDSYNHLIEVTKAVYGPKGTNFKQKLHNIYVMGRIGNRVVSYRIALIGSAGSDKYHKGDITKRELPYGKEFRGAPTTNWKKGNK